MRSVRYEQFGDPAQVLSVEDVEKPAVGPGMVLVRMRVRSINPSDVLTVRGLYGSLPRLPATPGNEGVGVVEEVGEGVTTYTPGQRVIPLGAGGTWQEYVAVHAAQLIPAPDAMSDETAAQFVVNPLTAWIMIVEDLKVGEGEWLLQTAAGSTLGQMVLQIARLRGFRTINVVRRREQAAELQALGADEVICSSDEDIVKRVMAITDGKGVPYAIDAVGGDVTGKVVRSLRAGGTALIYGVLSLEAVTLDATHLVFKTPTLRGFWLTRWFQHTPPETVQRVMSEMMGLLSSGQVAPPVERTYDLSEVVEAVAHSERPGRHGKVLLVG